MKRIIILYFLLAFQLCFGQSIPETEKLAATCKVWGFLKYYHPTVASGKTNIDQQLFDILPKVEQAQSNADFSLVIEKWIASLGEVPVIKQKKQNKKIVYFEKNFDLSWIENTTLFSPQLSQTLRRIENNRWQGKQFYICTECGPTKTTVLGMQNEIDYPDFQWENRNLRLLTLFRYWNLVEYFFPYKYQMDIKWDVTLTDMIPQFVNPESEINYYATVGEIVARLDDTHAALNSNMKYWEFIGMKFMAVKFKIIDEKAIITGFHSEELAKESDLRYGDIITKVGGKTIAEIINEKKKYIRGSNYGAKLANFNFALLNGSEDTIAIEFIRNEKTATKNVKRYPVEKLNIMLDTNEAPESSILIENVGYINIAKLQVKNLSKIMNEFKDTQAIIFDARCYPSDNLSSLAEYLNPKEKEFAKFLLNDISYPGKFVWGEPILCGKKNPNYYRGKVIVLVNESTMSAGEFTVMLLQTAPDVTVVGSQTAAADGNNCNFTIMKDFKTSFSSLGVFYPDGRETQRIGIVPDIEVKPTIWGIHNKTDEILNRAMKFVLLKK